MSPPNKYLVAPHVVFQGFDDEAILFNIETERYFRLNSTAREMFKLLTEFGFSGAVDALADRFDISRDVLLVDLDKLQRALREFGLLAANE